MRFLLTSIGSGGDLHPFIAVGRALQARGHEVLFLANPHFEPRIRAAGLGFTPLGTEEEYLRTLRNARLANPILSPLHVISQLLSTTVEPTVEALERLIPDFRPDAILRHHISYGARWVARRHGVPSATGILTPLFWFSREHPGIYHPFPIPHQPQWLGRVSVDNGAVAFRWILDRPLNRIAARLGYPPTRNAMFQESFDADLTLGLWSPHYRGPAPDDPEHGRICGFAWHDRAHPGAEHPPEEIERFLDEDPGDPPIVFTLGTSVVHHAGRFYARAAEACRLLGRRGLLLTGSPEYAPPACSLPPGVRAFTYAPFSTLLPRAAATVHHGGIGTTAQAMRSGKPAVIIPFANDEFDNAYRARHLGVAATTRPTFLTSRRLARTIASAIDSAEVRARAEALGRKLRAEDGAAAAAVELEGLAAVGGRGRGEVEGVGSRTEEGLGT